MVREGGVGFRHEDDTALHTSGKDGTIENEDLFKGLKNFLKEKFKHSLSALDSIIQSSEKYYSQHRDITEVAILQSRIRQLDAENDRINDMRPQPEVGVPMMLPQEPLSQFELMNIGRKLEIGIETQVLEFLIQALENRGIGHRFDDVKPKVGARRKGR